MDTDFCPSAATLNGLPNVCGTLRTPPRDAAKTGLAIDVTLSNIGAYWSNSKGPVNLRP